MLGFSKLDDYKDDIFSLYRNNNSLADIGKIYNCSPVTVFNLFKKNNILMRHDGNYGRSRKIFFNQQFFDTIDTEAKGYFLGLLMADGNVIVPRYMISLQLKLDDISLINAFSNYVSFPKEKIRIRNRICSFNGKEFKSAEIVLNSKHMANSLIKHGCVPRKSLILEFPTTVPDHLIHHFCRGYFDGDGSICIGSMQKNGIISICGSLVFLKKFQSILINNLGTISTYIRQPHKIYNLICRTQSHILRIFDYLYKDATIYLNRKYKKFLEVERIWGGQ